MRVGLHDFDNLQSVHGAVLVVFVLEVFVRIQAVKVAALIHGQVVVDEHVSHCAVETSFPALGA